MGRRWHTSEGAMPRIFTIVSIVVHAVVIAGVLVVQVLAVGALPTPRQPIAFEGAMPVRVVDIPLPPPARRASASTAAPVAVGPEVAPIDAPTGIAPEAPASGGSGDSTSPLSGVESGFHSNVGLTPIEVVPPPPPPSPQRPLRLREGITPPQKIVNLEPVYSPAARASRIEGVVILEAVIDTHGNVTSARVLRALPLLDQSALDAVRQWKFTPATLNGIPVPVYLTVTINFKLTDR
jgi:periplasmic protein TonB